MPHGQGLAKHLVEYDRRLAADVLEMICETLGGPVAHGDHNVEKIRAFLHQADVGRAPQLAPMSDVGDAPSTTEEWKLEFSHHERLRSLGVHLAELLS